MTVKTQDLDTLAVNVIRGLAMDGPQKAKSGHPGTAMALAPVGWVLYSKVMHHNPANPAWPDRDRFILSAGHACILQYSLLYLMGYDLSLDDLRNFRQWGSKTPGHPEVHHTPGVETTTGPLGQGISTAVGMALSERFLATYFNRPGYEVVGHFTYVLASDGDLMEGVSYEACSLAGHLQLSKLIVLYDDNRITIEGSTELAFSEDVAGRFEALGWQVQKVDDANDLQALYNAIQKAQQDKRPSLIIVRSHIAYPSPHKQDTAAAHGAPLGEEEVRATKEVLGLPADRTFYIPPELEANRGYYQERGRVLERRWIKRLNEYEEKFPKLAALFRAWMEGELPGGWDEGLPEFSVDKSLATRVASGKVLNALAARIPNLVGGSADLAPSTKTWLKGYEANSREQPGGRNFHFGIREHAMAAVLNGMALHGGVIPFGSTFFVFSDYMRPSIRLAALMRAHVIYVWTHDSIGLGEDGPTHQAVEQLPSLRALPGFTEIRPADATETVEAWKVAVSRRSGPVGLILSRQSLPVLDRSKYAAASGVKRGAYVLLDCAPDKPQVILIASGSEVHPTLGAARLLQEQGIPTRVVSMPSWTLFEEQSDHYKQEVLPDEVKVRVAVEAAIPLGWERYVGERGGVIAMRSFGASAPGKVNMEKFGFTSDNIADTAKALWQDMYS